MTEPINYKEKPWLIPLIVALIGLLGGFVGVTAGHFYAMRQQKEKSLIYSRTNAYATFYKAQSKNEQSSYLKKRGYNEEADKLLSESWLLYNEAKFGIAIFGSKSVIEAMARLFDRDDENYHITLIPDKDQQVYIDDIHIFQQMRNEIFRNDPNQKVEDKDLMILLNRAKFKK